MARIRRGRKDANHNEIKAVFEQMGCSVADLYNAGVPGFPDIVLGVSGRNVLVEIKNPNTSYGRAGLNENQTAFDREWRGGKVRTVTSVAEAAQLANEIRRS